VGVFCGKPYARKVHWNGVSYEECQGAGCQQCAAGNRASLRVALNFYHLAEKRMKIVEGGLRWFGDIVKVRKKYGLGTWAFEVTRNGVAAPAPQAALDAVRDALLTRHAARLAEGRMTCHSSCNLGPGRPCPSATRRRRHSTRWMGCRPRTRPPSLTSTPAYAA
jgi:hypothetical protein